jgi:hypothetical protein
MAITDLQNFPKMLYRGEEAITVGNEEEEARYISEGYGTTRISGFTYLRVGKSKEVHLHHAGIEASRGANQG